MNQKKITRDVFRELRVLLGRYEGMTEDSIQRILSALTIVKVARKRKLLSVGEPTPNIYYLNAGLLRCYFEDEEKNEHTVELVAEGNFYTDVKAFLTRGLSTINIEAIEDCELFCLSYENLYSFYDEIPRFERMVRKIIENYFVKAMDRHRKEVNAGYQAQARFEEFLRAHPKLTNRVPSVYLASYLGIAPETLSRLRNKYVRSRE